VPVDYTLGKKKCDLRKPAETGHATKRPDSNFGDYRKKRSLAPGTKIWVKCKEKNKSNTGDIHARQYEEVGESGTCQ